MRAVPPAALPSRPLLPPRRLLLPTRRLLLSRPLLPRRLLLPLLLLLVFDGATAQQQLCSPTAVARLSELEGTIEFDATDQSSDASGLTCMWLLEGWRSSEREVRGLTHTLPFTARHAPCAHCYATDDSASHTPHYAIHR